jgi:hypothetical protein
MPRYRYICQECQLEQFVFHLFDEKLDLQCKKCGLFDSLQRALTTPLHLKKDNIEHSDLPIGELTEEYIEKNRKLLEQEKEKIKEETYEPS